MARRQSFTRADVTRAILGARAAGLDEPEVRILPTGEIRVRSARTLDASETPQDVLDEIAALRRANA